MYDVKHLRYFVAVATERSFTRGAERLHMAQPPLSRHIQEMEQELGTKLFDREARPLVLTPAGQLFYEQAVQVIQRAEQMRAAMKRFVAAERPRFVMGLVPSMLYARLPEVIRRFRELAPNVALSLSEMNSTEQIQALKDGRINAGFGRLRLNDPGVKREVLREERFAVALPPDHPLAATEAPIELEAFEAFSLVVYPKEPRPSYADMVITMFQDVGYYPAEIIEVREMQTALVMVAAGEGICIVPESVQRMGRVDVVFRPLASGSTVPMIISHRIDDRSDDLQLLFRVFAELFSEWGVPLSASVAEAVETAADH